MRARIVRSLVIERECVVRAVTEGTLVSMSILLEAFSLLCILEIHTWVLGLCIL